MSLRGLIAMAVLSALAGTLPAAGPVEIIGHRGASYDAPENTVAAVKLAFEQGADAVEFDVMLTKDGQIVGMHDSDTKRTAGVAGRVVDMTLAELQKLDVGTWKDSKFAGERIPTLAQLLAAIPAGKRAFIEVKCGPEIMPELKRVLASSKLAPEQTVIISFSAEVIAASKNELPERTAYWIVGLGNGKRKPRKEWTAADLIARGREINADGLDLSANPMITTDFVKQCMAAKLPVYVWTVNDVEIARQMIDAGVLGITTDRPAWLREQLAK